MRQFHVIFVNLKQFKENIKSEIVDKKSFFRRLNQMKTKHLELRTATLISMRSRIREICIIEKRTDYICSVFILNPYQESFQNCPDKSSQDFNCDNAKSSGKISHLSYKHLITVESQGFKHLTNLVRVSLSGLYDK